MIRTLDIRTLQPGHGYEISCRIRLDVIPGYQYVHNFVLITFLIPQMVHQLGRPDSGQCAPTTDGCTVTALMPVQDQIFYDLPGLSIVP